MPTVFVHEIIGGWSEDKFDDFYMALATGEILAFLIQLNDNVREVPKEVWQEVYNKQIFNLGVGPSELQGQGALLWHPKSGVDMMGPGKIRVDKASLDAWNSSYGIAKKAVMQSEGLAEENASTGNEHRTLTRKNYFSVEEKLELRAKHIGLEKVLKESNQATSDAITRLMKSDSKINDKDIPGDRSMRKYVTKWKIEKT